MTKTRQWLIFTAVAVLVVFAAGYLLLVKPQRANAGDLRTQATTKAQANQLLLTQIATLEAEHRSLPAQQKALQKFTTQVPDNAAEPTLIRQLSAVANGAGVDLVSLTPGSATLLTATTTTTDSTSLTPTAAPAGQLVELPIAIDISGTYPNVETFFQELEKLPRALITGGWTLSPDTSGDTTGNAGTTTGTTSNLLTGTLNSVVFYSPPASTATTAVPGTTTTVPSTTGTTTTTTPTTGTTTPIPSTPAATIPATPAS